MWANIPDIIFVTGTTGDACGENFCHVEKFLHMRNVEGNLFGHNLCCFVSKSFLSPFTLFCREIYFVVIHARFYVGEIELEIVSVEKK